MTIEMIVVKGRMIKNALVRFKNLVIFSGNLAWIMMKESRRNIHNQIQDSREISNARSF